MKGRNFFKPDRLRMALFGIIVTTGFSAVVMLLWNLLIPEIFGLNMINFWQAAGLLILSRILFSSSWGGGKPHDRHMDNFRDNPIHEKWMKMSDKEREDFINKRREFFHESPFDIRDFFGKKTERTERNEKNETNNQ